MWKALKGFVFEVKNAGPHRKHQILQREEPFLNHHPCWTSLSLLSSVDNMFLLLLLVLTKVLRCQAAQIYIH